MDLGRFGIWTTTAQIGESEAGRAAASVEALGFGTLWLGGSPRLDELRPLLAATTEIVVGASIVNIWAYPDPGELAAEWADLEDEFPGRVMVGLGVGHPEAVREYKSPLRAMTDFLDAVDGAPTPIPRERRVLAALGPRMLALGAERSAGAIPYFVPPAHTRAAREILGERPLLAPELSAVIGPDLDVARSTARAEAEVCLGLHNYATNLERCGFAAADLDGGGSERLLETMIPHSSDAELVALIAAHLRAGADHVALRALGAEGLPPREWTRLAEAARAATGRAPLTTLPPAR